MRIEDSQILRLYGDRVGGVIFTLRERPVEKVVEFPTHSEVRLEFIECIYYSVRTLFKEGIRVEEDCMAHGYSSHYSLLSGIPTSQGL